MPSSTGLLKHVLIVNLINLSTIQVKFVNHAQQTAQHALSTVRQISQNVGLAMMEANLTVLRSFVDLFAIQLPHGTGTNLHALNAQLEHG